jgi:hypothetical protein
MKSPASPHPPTQLDALAPVVVLIILLFLAMVLYGVDAANGPLQVALLVSAGFAALVAYKNGYTVAVLQDADIGGVSSAMGAIFILLAVGALIGTWNLAVTIPAIVSDGLALLRPVIFFVTVASAASADRRCTTHDPAQGVDHLAQRIRPLRHLFGHQGHIGGDERPLVIGHIAGVRSSAHRTSVARGALQSA